ncbi:MAG: Lipoyl-[acyl-carrier-protein]-protein-N-lipoyltransferase [Pseudomonadota bacterium]|jgi:lipoyl(octanoyl) transferase
MNYAIRQLGLQPYSEIYTAMQSFTAQRNANTIDELWIVEHPPVYTFGLNGKKEHLLKNTDIPVIYTDRGGQITYHAPGQLILYILFDIQRRELSIRQLVTLLEQTMIATLAQYGLIAQANPQAPGVYLNHQKIGSIGLRIRKGYCYHGLSLNNDLDLTPFESINPCGFQQLKMTSLAQQQIFIQTEELAIAVIAQLNKQLAIIR